MRALVQRVTEAEVTSRATSDQPWESVGKIGAGLCVLVGITPSDSEAEAVKIANKIWGLRVFGDETGVMNLSLGDVGDSSGAAPREVLVVSQFTLYGDTTKGRRPSWVAAGRPEQAEPLVELVVETLGDLGAAVEAGRFRTDMRVALVNDGPVTLMLEVERPPDPVDQN